MAAVGCTLPMHPKHLSIHDFTYELPDERIARYPLQNRDESRLLVYRNGTIAEDTYRHIAQYLPQDSLLIFNNTKVVEARLLFQKPTGATVEIFCLEPGTEYADITTALLQQEKVTWKCLIGGASKWKPGQTLEKYIGSGDDAIVLQAKYLSKETESFSVELSWTPAHLSFAEILHHAGVMPLPPYIKRTAEITDAERYQTIYAHTEGSVAAPTAGLHFTDAVFEQLKQKGIHDEYVTLHVGAGTFRPVKSDVMEQHHMHSEYIDVTTDCIQQIIAYLDKHITVTGTTSLRTVESLYWMGVKLLLDPDLTPADLTVHQWDPYELDATGITAAAALEAVLNCLKKHQQQRLIATTSLLIAPGYEIRIPHALVTNFHQPQSTLLLLVAAFIGNDWKQVYNYALQNDFRFLSYGDGCLLFRGGRYKV
ncbi:MAG: S-adenosylmethionine:tRNA ribosyltransferase-isomerase [Chitinophagaceae bacterium]